MPSHLRNLDRFVDDITSCVSSASRETIQEWVLQLREDMVTKFGLDITYEIKNITEYTQFLDFQYKVVNKKLITDLYRKKTDANRYLEFSSYHPRHTFRSIVYSQALRYRRLVNDEETYIKRLDELKGFFLESSYPADMVQEVIADVKRKPRVLGYRDKDQSPMCSTAWIVTYGAGYEETRDKARELNRVLESSKTWKDQPPDKTPKLQVVTRRASNLKDTLFKRRALALGSGSKVTVPCTKPGERRKGPRCQTCSLVSGTDSVTNNTNTIRTAGGDCKSRNIVYTARCKLCTTNNVYVGKTVTPLHKRVNGHRNTLHALLKANDPVACAGEITDENILGVHLYFDHGLRNGEAFNENYVFDIVHQGPADSLRKHEQSIMDSLESLYPLGLNQIKSVSGK